MSTGVGVISLGCPRNLIDSETIISRLKDKKFKIKRIEDAEVIFVNTCAFIKEAKEESIETILNLVSLKEKGIIKKLIVGGCLVQRYKDELLRNIKGVDAYVGRLSLNEEINSHMLTPKHFAYIKISEGCGNSCSYCAIPKIKGALASRSRESIIKEVVSLDKSGVKEIILIGQDITMYGLDKCGEPKLTSLIKDILKNIRNVRWVRLLYLNPERISDDLIELIAKEKRICKYIDIPIQHINDRMLKLMNRRIDKKGIVSLIERIRNEVKNVFLRTSIIVGFPGETKQEFQELLEFVKKTKFERLGCFIYSREEGTRAHSFKGQIHYRTKKNRFDQIMKVQQDVSAKINKLLMGSIKEVMIDEKDTDEDDLYLARLEQDAPEVDGVVYVKSKKELKPGEFHKVKISDTLEYDLIGEL